MNPPSQLRRDSFMRYDPWFIAEQPLLCSVGGRERWMLVRRWCRTVSTKPFPSGFPSLPYVRTETGPVLGMKPYTGVLPKQAAS